MVKKVNGFANSDEALTGDMQFFLFRTILDIRPTGIVALANDPDYIDDPVLPYTDLTNTTHTTVTSYNNARNVQIRFDNLIKGISLFAQPVIIGEVVVITTLTGIQSGIPSESSNTSLVTVYDLRFALEKKDVLTEQDLADVLHNVSGFVGTPASARNFVLDVFETLQ